MQDIHDKIAFLVQEQFPDFYQEEGANLVDFIQGYFEFLEEHDQTTEVARNLFTERDVDTATAEYISHFRAKYLNNLPKIDGIDDSFLVKNIQSIYKSKGSQQSIQTLLRLMFNEEVTIKYPGDDILRPSSAEWIKPRYLELEIKDKTVTFIGKQVQGATSGAKAFVENVARLFTPDNRQIDVAFLSGIRGTFQTGELISDSTGDVIGSPKIVGSLSSLDIINGGANFTIGDEFDVISSKGFRGKARVTATIDDTGRVNFTLVDGGTGYTLTTTTLSGGDPVTEVIISNNVIIPANTDFVDGMVRFDSVKFPYAQAVLQEAWTEFSVGDTVELYQGANSIANTFVLSRLSTNTLILSIESNTAAVTDADSLINPANTSANAGNVTVTDVTVTANVTGLNSTAFGIHGYTGGNTVYANSSVMYLLHANGDIEDTGAVANVSGGSGASFNIGSLTAEETIAIYTDLLVGTNDVGTQYVNPGEVGANSGTYDSVNDTLSMGINGLAPNTESQVSNGEFKDTYVQAGGVDYTANDTISVNSAAYANGSAVVGDQGSGLALSINTVDGSGAITAVSVDNGGTDYTYLPEITINSANGSGAVIVPVLAYGFPKQPLGNLDTVIEECLDILNGSIGTIASLSGINPGSGYNFDPFVVVINPYIAAYDRKDFIIQLTGVTGVYRIGETIQQNITVTAPLITVGNQVSSNTSDFLIGEGVTQQINSTATAVGVVLSWTAATSKLQVQTLSDGNFNASGNNIVGVTTGAEYEVDTISLAETITNAAKGVITDSSGVGSTVELNVRRTSFNTQFTIGGGSIVGSTSGASGTLTDATQNPATRGMGDNAVLTARATVADNIASELTIVDSGVGFVEGEQVTLQTTGNPIIITANTRLGTAGTQEGYWKTEKHFTSSDRSIIQDNDFYQEYSYVVKTGVSLSRYEEVLKDILHVAGTRLFGEVLKVAELDTQITIANSSITADV